MNAEIEQKRQRRCSARRVQESQEEFERLKRRTNCRRRQLGVVSAALPPYEIAATPRPAPAY